MSREQNFGLDDYLCHEMYTHMGWEMGKLFKSKSIDSKIVDLWDRKAHLINFTDLHVPRCYEQLLNRCGTILFI